MNLEVSEENERTARQNIHFASEKYMELLVKGANITKEHLEFRTAPDVFFAGELIDDGYLKGSAVRGSTGILMVTRVIGITVKGRLFLEELQDKKRILPKKRDFIGNSIMHIVFLILGVLVTTFTTLITTHLSSSSCPFCP